MSFRTPPVALTRPPKHATSAVAVAAAASRSLTVDTLGPSTTASAIPPSAVGPASFKSPNSRAKPPPSLNTPLQYNNQFPSLFDGPPSSFSTEEAAVDMRPEAGDFYDTPPDTDPCVAVNFHNSPHNYSKSTNEVSVLSRNHGNAQQVPSSIHITTMQPVSIESKPDKEQLFMQQPPLLAPPSRHDSPNREESKEYQTELHQEEEKHNEITIEHDQCTPYEDIVLSTGIIRVKAIISGWKAGTIIGRQGAVISSLRRECNCKIAIFDDAKCADRVLTINGPAVSVWDALRRVCFLLSSRKEQNRNEDNNNISAQDDQTTVNLTLAVPSPLCGCLIGRRGTQIRQFRQKYHILFIVSSAPIPDTESPERPVTITGNPQNVAECLKEVCNLFANAAEGTIEKTNTVHPAEPPAGSGYFRSNWQRNVSGAGVHVHGTNTPETVTPGTKARSKTTKPAPSFPRPIDNFGPSETGEEVLSNSIRECSFELSTGEMEVHLLVPNDVVGSIIGRRGKTISDIRETSCAFISITDGAFPPAPPPTAIATLQTCTAPPRSNGTSRGTRRDRVILIRGSTKSVRTARYLMGSSILNAQRGSGSGGGALDCTA